MRTSRVSRETAHLVNALSSSSEARSKLRSSPRGTQRPQKGANAALEESESGSHSGTIQHAEDIDRSRNNVAAKRKRDLTKAAAHAENGNAVKEEVASPRRSPRKAPKLEQQGSDANVIKKAKRQPAKRIKGPNGQINIEPPANWEEIYSITAEMRKRVLAPVDTMGCESLADTMRSPRDQRLQTLISLMLSSQTKDTVTAVAIRNMQENVPGGFCLEGILNIQPVELNRLIEKVGFHNNKTKFIKQTTEILRDRFAGDIPDTIEGLVSLPGVGPKMAYLCMSAAWGRDEGIGVDVHVHRITNLWGWHKTSTPEQTRAELEAWLPREKWHDINHLLVGFGQTICLPVGRRCGECDLAKQKLCPSAVANTPVRRKVKKEIEIKVEDEQVVNSTEVVVERDDVGLTVEVDTVDDGSIAIKDEFGAKMPDIADSGIDADDHLPEQSKAS